MRLLGLVDVVYKTVYCIAYMLRSIDWGRCYMLHIIHYTHHTICRKDL